LTAKPIPRCASSQAWAWKSAYHSFEHALVGYIVVQQLERKPITLYYSFDGDTPTDLVQPYYFSGSVDGIDMMPENQGARTQRVTFINVH
jgi:hypothetical protein